LTVWYVLTLGASLLLFALMAYAVRARELYGELNADLEIRGHRLVEDARPALLGLDVAGDLVASGRLVVVPAMVREAPDRPIYRSPSWPRLGWDAERALAAAARDATPLVSVDDSTGAALHVLTIVVKRPGTDALQVQLAAPTAPVRAELAREATIMALGIVLVLAIAGVGSAVTSRRALAPVDEIVARVRRIQARQLSERLDVKAESDELSRLVVTLNEMLDRIETSVRAARRFAGDSSHELQTPLAAMRAAVETCLAGDRPAGDYRAMAGELLAEIARLSMLIRDLRLLALADAGHLVTSPERVDLAALALECCEVARAIAEDAHVLVDVEIDAQPMVSGSALHLRRVLLNLTENAIKYSPPGSTVGVSVGLENGEAVAAVRDEGCGISSADLPFIFQPFYRADPARARATGGSGLGLAIADQVTRAHGGRLEVSSASGSGATFTVRLPAIPA
jgi:signal transduction histidine kinase